MTIVVDSGGNHVDLSEPVRHVGGSYDLLGRQVPRTLGFGAILMAIPGVAQRVRMVPASATPDSGVDEDGPFSLVQCPCGAQRVARPVVDQCSGCERWYVGDDSRVFVIYGDMPIPGSPEPPPVD